MLTAEKVSQEVQKLPDVFQKEVLDFVEFLLHKSQNETARKEEREWNNFSLKSALRNMEDDDNPWEWFGKFKDNPAWEKG
jgi:DNA polymerase sigma